MAFAAELETNLLRLCVDIHSGRYQHGMYNHRIVNEKKRRDIAVASVRDRVVHRLLYDYLVPLVDSRLDFDVWSCRKGKGLHQGLQRTTYLATKYAHAWVWRADISKFFDNIDQHVLKACLARYVSDAKAQKVLDEVIGSYNTLVSQSVSQSVSQGIPIGNLTSQIFANIYLHEFDRLVRHTIKPLGYVRYGDDFVLFLPSQQQALAAQQLATDWLHEELKLAVHSKNNVVVTANQGLHFLGHSIYPCSPLSADRFMIDKIRHNINPENAASYQAMHVPHRLAKQLPWLLLPIVQETGQIVLVATQFMIDYDGAYCSASVS
jgi:RNA-directed DNA polymerase